MTKRQVATTIPSDNTDDIALYRLYVGKRIVNGRLSFAKLRIIKQKTSPT